MKTYRILDLDNTISNDAWRIPRIHWQHKDPEFRYNEYHSLAAFDPCGNYRLFNDTPHAIVIMTARPSFYRAVTEEWLKRRFVKFEHLIMRNAGDRRSSVEVKREQLAWLLHYGINDIKQIADAYDDRQDIVEMYKEYGIDAKQISLHSVDAYNPANTVAG